MQNEFRPELLIKYEWSISKYLTVVFEIIAFVLNEIEASEYIFKQVNIQAGREEENKPEILWVVPSCQFPLHLMIPSSEFQRPYSLFHQNIQWCHKHTMW